MQHIYTFTAISLVLFATFGELAMADATEVRQCRVSCAVDASRATEMCRDDHYSAVQRANQLLSQRRDELRDVSAGAAQKALEKAKSRSDMSWDTLRRQNEVIGQLKRRANENEREKQRLKQELTTNLNRCEQKVKNEMYRCEAMCY
tara:strand:+ start:6384 stop:6824 length:441 start_codon:yes stop_codon:yes gene_type:complete